MKNILVTGGAGFIGVNFVRHWVKQRPNDRIVVIDALTYAGNRNSISSLIDSSSITFIHQNICNRKIMADIFSNYKIDTVVHFAAESHVDRSILTPRNFVDTNVVGTQVLLECAHELWKHNFSGKRFHHVSTDEVYGELDFNAPAFTEATCYAPRSPYAASKASSDMFVKAYYSTFGLPITISNCSNNYGPYQFPEKLIPLTILNILNGRTLPVYGSGENIRDWLYVIDHCRAIEKILLFGKAGETYNVGGNTELSNIELVRKICDRLDIKIENNDYLKNKFPHSMPANAKSSEELIRFVDDRPGHDLRYAINAEKIANELEFLPGTDFDAGLDITIDWYLDNEPWWKMILSGEYTKWINSHYSGVLE